MSDEQIKRVTPAQAWQILSTDTQAVLLDVRSKVEHDYVGHPAGALNVMWKDYPEWQENVHFVAEVKAALNARGGDNTRRPILAICRSGVRSLAAVKVLAAAGYTDLSNVEQGFEGDKDAHGHRCTVSGWRYHQLPWEQT